MLPAIDPKSTPRRPLVVRGPLVVLLAVLVLTGAGCARTSVADEPDVVARANLLPTFTPLPPATHTPTPLPSPTAIEPYATRVPDQFELAGLPIRIEIPALGVDAAIEHVGINALNQIDVPKIPANVAWYKEGPLPGQIGNSLISGHLDSATAEAVFIDLRKLIPGDELVITYQNNERYVFEVFDKERYYFDQAPMDKIIGDSGERLLNLITCDGAWDQGTTNYQQRLVVYTRLKDA